VAFKKPLVISPSSSHEGHIGQIQSGDSLGIRDAALAATTDPISADPSFSVIPEMELTLETSGGCLVVLFDANLDVRPGDSLDYAVFLDGSQAGGLRTISLPARTAQDTQDIQSFSGLTASFSLHALLTLARGSHVVDVRWRARSGAARAIGIQRGLIVVEVF